MRICSSGGARRHGRRGVRRPEQGVVGLTAPDALLRPACEAALEVARVGSAAAPPVPVPGPLRPLVRFARLNDAAIATVRRVLDADATFRAHVLATYGIAGMRDHLDEASLLFLERPTGWVERLEELSGVAAVAAATASATRAEVSAARRLEVVQAALDRAEAALAPLRDGAEASRAQLAEERRARRTAESELGRLRKRVGELEGEAAGRSTPAPSSGRSEAGATAPEVEGDRQAEVGADVVAASTAAVAAAEERAERAEAQARRAGAEALARARAAASLVPPEPAPPAEPGPGLDRRALEAAVSAAAGAVRSLADALGLVAQALAPPAVDDGRWAVEEVSASPVAEHGAADDGGWPPAGTVPWGTRRGAASPPRARAGSGSRTPAPLPPAIFDHTTAAASHLLQVPGMLVLVDGYNVTRSTKDELRLPDQRRWLLDTAAGAAARTGAEFEVVFDGAAAGRPADGPRRLGVQVRFTSADEEADDALLAIVVALPVGRPVTVVSDDRRVRDGAHRLGANVLGVGQLVEAMRR